MDKLKNKIVFVYSELNFVKAEHAKASVRNISLQRDKRNDEKEMEAVAQWLAGILSATEKSAREQ